MRVAINAQLQLTGHWGGVEQFVLGLVYGLGHLDDGTEEYVIIGHYANADWLKSYLGANQTLVRIHKSSLLASVRNWLGPLGAPAGRMWRRLCFLVSPASTAHPIANKFEAFGAQVVHFPFQMYTPTNIPYIYNPHDLQHLHYPQFFAPEDIVARETAWRPACRHAAAIATDSRWIKDDVAKRYNITPEKVFAIPMGSPTSLYGTLKPDTLAVVRHKFNLPDQFALYPAQTWQHKNHLRLLEAMALLRDRDHLTVNLVCTGRQNDFWRVIKKRIDALGLNNQVRFLGFVPPTDLRALYHLAQFVIFPSLFEGGGLPVLEAFYENVPLACSNVTSLPEYAGNAALYFDPTSVESIADALRRITTDTGLREELRQRGSVRVRLFTWERTAKTYRALYRQVAGVPLSEEDRALLAESLQG